jgi:hypothetical protein
MTRLPRRPVQTGWQPSGETGDAVLEGHHMAAHCRCANRSPGTRRAAGENGTLALFSTPSVVNSKGQGTVGGGNR